MKQQPGKDLSIRGSATLVRSLLSADLLDELRLLVHPIVLGCGKRLFEEGSGRLGLRLVDFKALSAGVVALAYQAGEK